MALETTISEDELVALQDAAKNVQIKEIAITSAQLLAANATPIPLIPPQGPGKVIELLSAVLILDFNSAAYTTNGDVTLQTDGSNTAQSDQVAGAAWLLATADQVTAVQMLSAEVTLDVNEGLELVVATGDPAAGDSPARVRVSYRVHDTGL